MRTNKTHKFISLFFLVVFIIAGNSVISSKKGDIDSHLNDYAYYNVAHHDNIDDEPHTHTHKHSEDGDEHEHNHEHSKVTQPEIKLLNHSIKVLAKVSVIEAKQGFSEKNLISNPHPNRIYRPPIHS